MFQDTWSDVGGRYPHRRAGMRLITQRSQVQILSPLPVRPQVRGPFALRSGRASFVHVGRMWADVVGGRGRMWVDTGGYRAEVGELDANTVAVNEVARSDGRHGLYGSPQCAGNRRRAAR